MQTLPRRIVVVLEPEAAPEPFIASAACEAVRLASVVAFVASLGLIAGIVTGAI